MKNVFCSKDRFWQGLLMLSFCLAAWGYGEGGILSLRAQTDIQSSVPETDEPATEDAITPSQLQTMTVTKAVHLGDDRYAQADYRGAVEAYSQALQAYKLNAYALYHRGNAYRQLKEYESAIADYTSALKIAPDNLFAYLYRGMALSENQKPEAAIADFSQVITQNPKHALAFQKRGESHLAKGNSDAAIQDFEKAASLYEKDEKFRKQSQVLKQIKKAKSRRQSKK